VRLPRPPEQVSRWTFGSNSLFGRSSGATLADVKRSLIVFLAVSLLGACTAQAKVPAFKYANPSIVPGESIAGVAVGDSKGEATGAWGAPDECFVFAAPVSACAYTLKSAIGPEYVAAFYLKKGKVVAVEIDEPEPAGALAKVTKLKTERGIKIGSTLALARQKYRIPVQGGGEAGLSRALLKKDNRCTLFYAPEEPYEKITSITIGVCRSIVSLTP